MRLPSDPSTPTTLSGLLAAAAMAFISIHLHAQEIQRSGMHVFYRTVKVDQLSIFYREAGPKDAPTVLLLHGFHTSSRMFEPLLVRLSDRYHLVALDYPGFGIHCDWRGFFQRDSRFTGWRSLAAKILPDN